MSVDAPQSYGQEMQEKEGVEEGGAGSSNTSDLSDYNGSPDGDEGVDFPDDGNVDHDGGLGQAAAGDTSDYSEHSDNGEEDEVGGWTRDEVDHENGEQGVKECAGEEMGDVVKGVGLGESLGEHEWEDGEEENDVVHTRELISSVSDALEFEDSSWVRSLPTKVI